MWLKSLHAKESYFFFFFAQGKDLGVSTDHTQAFAEGTIDCKADTT